MVTKVITSKPVINAVKTAVNVAKDTVQQYQKSGLSFSTGNQSSSGSQSSESSMTELAQIIGERLYYTFKYGPATDYASEEQSQEAVIKVNHDSEEVMADQARELALLNLTIQLLGETIQYNGQTIAAYTWMTEERKKLRQQYEDLGEITDATPADLQRLKIQRELLLAQLEDLKQNDNEPVANDAHLPEEVEHGFFSSAIFSFMKAVASDMVDTGEFALYAMDDPAGAGKATLNYYADMASSAGDSVSDYVDRQIEEMNEMWNDPVGYYQEAFDQSIAEVIAFWEQSSDEKGEIVGTFVAQLPLIGRKLLIPDKGWIDGDGKSSKDDKGTGKSMFIPTPETNKALADQITQDFGGTIKPAKGDGWTVNIPITYNNKSSEITLRIMNTSKMNDNYWRLSVQGKPAVDIDGNFSNDIVPTHIPITENAYDDIVSIINKLNGK